jgi:hypothetical protein
VLHLPGRAVGVPGSQLAQQPATRAQDDAVGRRADRHDEVVQPPRGRAHQPRQVGVTVKSASGQLRYRLAGTRRTRLAGYPDCRWHRCGQAASREIVKAGEAFTAEVAK